MCRLLALVANQPTRVAGSLLRAPHSLCRQSACDAQQQKHDNGWGLGYYVHGQAQRVRSVLPADQDPQFRRAAESLTTSILLAHIRRASMGEVAVRNSHPFVYGPWLFAHNGTLFGFDKDRDGLRRLILPQLLPEIKGDTDSEHAFFLFLSLLEGRDDPAAALAQTLHTLANLYPGTGSELSQLNFVATDGRQLLASRWHHSLSWLRRRGEDPNNPDRPMVEGTDYRAVVIASEPTTSEAWEEVPDQTILNVHPGLTTSILECGDSSPLLLGGQAPKNGGASKTEN